MGSFSRKIASLDGNWPTQGEITFLLQRHTVFLARFHMNFLPCDSNRLIVCTHDIEAHICDIN